MIKDTSEKVAAIVNAAGGRVVGRTKLQKITFILEAVGLGEGFKFEYHHYGPYSEDLATAAKDAVILGMLSEKEFPTSWGGSYSSYEIQVGADGRKDDIRSRIAQLGAKANSVELELAATALFLANEGTEDPWGETSRRKPEKAENGRLGRAKELYILLKNFDTPNKLPDII